MAQQLSTNTFGCAKWIVSSDATQGTHTTIATALTSASSGDTIFIRPGTYTENITLKAGVNLTAFGSDSSLNATGTVIINGTCTFTAAGTVTISGIQLQTNSAVLLAVTGTLASVVNLENCYLNCLNNTGITHSSSSASSSISFYRCTGNLGTTGIAYFTSTSAGNIGFAYCVLGNGGASTTASTISTGLLNLFYTISNSPFTTSSSATINGVGNTIDTSAINTTAFTLAGTGSANLNESFVSSNTASAISIGTGTTFNLNNVVIGSSNTNAITGAGTLTYSSISFANSSSLMNTTTQTKRGFNAGSISFDGGTTVLSNYAIGSWTPTIVGTVAGTTTYVGQTGYYTRIGNLVTCQFQITTSASTGTGSAVLGGLPFTVKNQSNGTFVGSILISGAGWAFPVGTTYAVCRVIPNGTVGDIFCLGTVTAGGALQMANAALTLQGVVTYQI